jgi:hypothetical protein
MPKTPETKTMRSKTNSFFNLAPKLNRNAGHIATQLNALPAKKATLIKIDFPFQRRFSSELRDSHFPANIADGCHWHR